MRLDRVLLVARDVAPSRAFAQLGPELEKRGVEVYSFLGHGQDVPLINGCDAATFAEHPCLVLTGMSSSQELAKEEILAAEVGIMFDNPVGFYADMFGCSTRAWFAPVREKARFVFVLSEEEAKKTQPLFLNSEVVASGNPVVEEAFYHKVYSGYVRRRLNVGSDELLMYCTAGKDRETNRMNFRGMTKAVSLLPDRHRWKVVFMLHGGDQNDPVSSYADLINVKGVNAQLLSAKEVEAMGFTALDVIAACDLMVAAVSTSGVEAACQRKPVIDFLTSLAVARMKKQTGSEVWPPCELGISRPVMGGPTELARAIQELMAPGGFDEMRARQEACFPKPSIRGVAIKKMADTVFKWLI